jgi:hypothetical protein
MLELLVMVCLPAQQTYAAVEPHGATLALRVADHALDIAVVMTDLCTAPGAVALALEHRP